MSILKFLQVVDAGTVLALYFEFQELYCKEKNLNGFDLESLEAITDKTEQFVRVKQLLSHFISWLAYRYKTDRTYVAKDQSNLEPCTVFGYTTMLIVAVS